MGTPRLNRNLRVLMAFKALAMSNVQTAFFVWYLFADLAASMALALQVASGFTLLGALLELPTGWFADRYGRKVSLIAGSVLAITGLCLYATAQYVGLYLLCGALISYTGWALMNGADSALATAMCATDYLDRVQQATYLHFETLAVRICGLSQAGGSLLAAWLVAEFGLRSTMWAQAVVYIPMLICACVLREPKMMHNRKAPALSKIIISLARRRQLALVLVFSGIISALTAITWKIAPLYYADVTAASDILPASALGILWAVYLASMWLVRPMFVRRFNRRFGKYGSLAVLLAIGVGCYEILGLTTSLVGLLVIFPLFWILPVQWPAMLDRVRELSDHEERATILSINRMVGYFIMSLGSSVISFVIQMNGLSVGFLFGGWMMGMLGGVVLLMMIRTDSRMDKAGLELDLPARTES